MNWSKTKTIFIICFFLLDVFLGYQLYDRQMKYNLDNISTQNADSLQKKDIKIAGNLPDPKQKITFLRGNLASFMSSDGKGLVAPLKAFEKDANNNVIQQITANADGTEIKSVFKTPIVAPKTSADQIGFLNQFIYHGEQYQYWFNKDNTMVFIQTYQGKPVYSTLNNQVGSLKVSLSSKGQITGYQQNYLNLEKPDNKANNSVDIITPTAAIDNLWRANDIPASGHPVISHVELGYFNLVGGTSNNNLLVFVPTWHVVVKTDMEKKDYFVNAIYGQILPLEESK